MPYSAILRNIQEAYLNDYLPWVVGFSGGKDSTALLQFIFYALSKLPKKKLKKEIHILCNDTKVENPAIISYVDRQLKNIKMIGKSKLFSHSPDLFKVKKVTPKLEDSFWVNLIGKGYPSPNRWFRWCTERLKINPTSDYIKKDLNKSEGVIIVLGTRKAESANRAASMGKYDNGERFREHKLNGAYVYAPIADLSNQEVWAYLLQAPNVWGSDNRELLELYGNACEGGECPFAIETGTQSCGKSRFGCWVCTVVDRDKSMESFIENGAKWMQGLLDYRNWLYEIRQQSYQYVPKRIKVTPKFGSFLLRTRHEMLGRLMKLQDKLSFELISEDEVIFIKNALCQESNGEEPNVMKGYYLRLNNGKELYAVSDFNLLFSKRSRLGPFALSGLEVLKTNHLNKDYKKSTRVMYYEVKV